MKVYIVLAHSDLSDTGAEDLGGVVHEVFLSRRRAEDYMRGLIGYMGRYDAFPLILEAGKAHDQSGTTYFQIIERDMYLAD